MEKAQKELLIRVGTNISRIRKEKGLTTTSLAEKCDMDHSNLIPIEKGRINVTLVTLCKIAEVLEVDPHVFFEFH
jgi:transcriptional regulator with XRE-family HTH domain